MVLSDFIIVGWIFWWKEGTTIFRKSCVSFAFKYINIFQKKNFLFKSFVKTDLSYIFTINMVSTVENCKKRWISLLKGVFFFSLIGNYLLPSNNSRQLIFNINAVVLIVLFCEDLRKWWNVYLTLSIFTVFLKNRSFISKIKRSKVTDYAALRAKNKFQDCMWALSPIFDKV